MSDEVLVTAYKEGGDHLHRVRLGVVPRVDEVMQPQFDANRGIANHEIIRQLKKIAGVTDHAATIVEVIIVVR